MLAYIFFWVSSFTFIVAFRISISCCRELFSFSSLKLPYRLNISSLAFYFNAFSS